MALCEIRVKFTLREIRVKNHVWGIRVSGHCFSANRVSGGTPLYFPFIEVSTLIIYKLYVKSYCFKYVPLFNLDVKLISYLGLF